MITGIHQHNILQICLQIKPSIVCSFQLRPIHISLDPIRDSTGKTVYKYVDILVLVDTLGDLFIDVEAESAYDVVLNVGPAIGQEAKTLVLGFLDEVAEFVRVGVVQDELLPLLLDLFTRDGFHVLELFLSKDNEGDGLDLLVPHSNVTRVTVVLYLDLVIKILF